MNDLGTVPHRTYYLLDKKTSVEWDRADMKKILSNCLLYQMFKLPGTSVTCWGAQWAASLWHCWAAERLPGRIPGAGSLAGRSLSLSQTWPGSLTGWRGSGRRDWSAWRRDPRCRATHMTWTQRSKTKREQVCGTKSTPPLVSSEFSGSKRDTTAPPPWYLSKPVLSLRVRLKLDPKCFFYLF